MVDAIEMIVTEDMKIVTSLPQNTALEDIMSSSTDDFCIYVWELLPVMLPRSINFFYFVNEKLISST